LKQFKNNLNSFFNLIYNLLLNDKELFNYLHDEKYKYSEDVLKFHELKKNFDNNEKIDLKNFKNIFGNLKNEILNFYLNKINEKFKKFSYFKKYRFYYIIDSKIKNYNLQINQLNFLKKDNEIKNENLLIKNIKLFPIIKNKNYMFQFDKFLFGDNKLENLFNIPKNNYKDYEIKTIGFSNYNLFIIFSFRRKFYYVTTNKFKIKNFINVKKLNKLNFDDKEVIGGDVGKICKLALSNNINLKYKGMIIKKKINSRVINHHFRKNKRSKKK
jgi:hypothetical protein